MENYPDLYEEKQRQISQFRQASPELMSTFGKLNMKALQAGVLSSKVKELIALCIGIAVRCDGCVAFHIADALKAGASREEIVEAINVAVLMGGGPALIYGAEALEALKQFENRSKESMGN